MFLFNSKNFDVPGAIAAEYGRIKNSGEDQKKLHKLLFKKEEGKEKVCENKVKLVCI